jgi:hypothetical protein
MIRVNHLLSAGHPNYQYFLVVAPVENTSVTTNRQAFDAAPEVVMIKVPSGRALEGIHLAPRRVHPRQVQIRSDMEVRGLKGDWETRKSLEQLPKNTDASLGLLNEPDCPSSVASQESLKGARSLRLLREQAAADDSRERLSKLTLGAAGRLG